MDRQHALILSLVALSSLPVSVMAGVHPMTVPLDSFINQHVDTLSQLRQQVTLDPVVRRRLARHFHTSGPAVVKYIQDNLVLKKMTHAGRYRVYCISRDGREYTINSRLPAGTPVFVLRTTGKPILKLACGNPMVASLPPVHRVAPSLEKSAPQLASLPSPAAAKIAPELANSGPVVVAMNSGPGVYVMPVTRVSPFIQGFSPRGGSPLGFLAGIPILAGIIGNKGNTSNTPTGTTGTGTTGTGTGTETTGTTGTGTTGTGTTGTGTTGTGTGTTGTGTGTTGTGTGTTGTGTTGTGTTGTGTTGTGTGTETTGTTGTGTTGTGTGTETTGTTGTGTGTETTGTGTLGTNTGTETGTGTGMTPVPEPSTSAAFAIGGIGLALLLAGARRRRKSVN